MRSRTVGEADDGLGRRLHRGGISGGAFRLTTGNVGSTRMKRLVLRNRAVLQSGGHKRKSSIVLIRQVNESLDWMMEKASEFFHRVSNPVCTRRK